MTQLLENKDEKSKNYTPTTQKKLSTAQRKLLCTIIARYDPQIFGYSALQKELERNEIKLALSTVQWYCKSARWAKKIDDIRKKMFSDHSDLLISRKGYRLAWLQKFVEDNENACRDRINALKEARVELEGKDDKPDNRDFDKLPLKAQKRLESLFQKVLDADDDIIEVEAHTVDDDDHELSAPPGADPLEEELNEAIAEASQGSEPENGDGSDDDGAPGGGGGGDEKGSSKFGKSGLPIKEADAITERSFDDSKANIGESEGRVGTKF